MSTTTISREALANLVRVSEQFLADWRESIAEGGGLFESEDSAKADQLAAHIAAALRAAQEPESEPAPVCLHCGADTVYWDAYADHNGDVVNVFDDSICGSCGTRNPTIQGGES